MRYQVLAMVALGALALSCDQLDPSRTARVHHDSGTGPIVVGHFASMTGAEKTFGESTDHGVRLAIEERNAKGGVKGRKIELITLDDAGKTQEAGTAVSRLINDDDVVAVLGEVASSLSLAAGPVAQQNHIPMISPSSTNVRVTQVGDMVFRVCFLDPFQGYVGAKFARENLHDDRVAILYDQGQAYSKGLAQEFSKAFRALGGHITTRQAYSGGDVDLSAQLQAIRDSDPQAIYLPGYYTDAGNIALQARKIGITVPLLGGDGWDSTKLTEIGGKAIEGSYFSNHYSFEDKRPAVQEFVARYKARWNNNVPDGLAALGYDAAGVLFDSMDRARSLDGDDLAAAIAATKNFPGVTGNITIDQDRNAVKSAVMLVVRDGERHYVATIDPPTRPLPVVADEPDVGGKGGTFLNKLLQTLVNAFALGALYALIALGYTLVYGVLGFINFAHSDVFTFGAWSSFTMASWFGWAATGSPWFALPAILFLTMGLCALLGVTIERLAYRPLRRAPRLNVLITAIGVSLLLQNVGQLDWAFGPNPQLMPSLIADTTLVTIAGVAIHLVDVIVLALAIVLVAALEFLIYRTRQGRAMRAVSFNERVASLMGIDVNKVVVVTFAIGSALAAAGGLLFAMKYPSLQITGHQTWILLGLTAFVAAVVGGIGDVRGAAAGALLIAAVQEFGSAYLSSQLRDVYVFGTLIVVLLVKPTGLFGKAATEKV